MNSHRKAKSQSLLFYVLVIAITTVAAPVAAASDDSSTPGVSSPEHCVVHVVGHSDDGEMRLSEPVCFSEFESAMEFAGLPNAESATPSSLTPEVLASSSIIAVHYEFKNYLGSSLAVSGGTCTGGFINFRTAYTNWNNRIYSTIHGCGGKPITHWDIAPVSGGNCSGAKYVAWSSVPDLGAMGGNTSCVKYGP